MQTWIEEDSKTSDFSNERLDDRFKVLVDRFSPKPSVSIPGACNGWSETIAAYRFFANDRVDAAKGLQPHQDATLQRIKEHDVVLLIQDTTEIEVTRLEEQVEGAGPLNDESRLGFFDHVLLAVTPGRIPLGVVDADIWARDFAEFRENQKDKQSKEKQRKPKPIEEKERLRWRPSRPHPRWPARPQDDVDWHAANDGPCPSVACVWTDRNRKSKTKTMCITMRAAPWAVLFGPFRAEQLNLAKGLRKFEN